MKQVCWLVIKKSTTSFIFILLLYSYPLLSTYLAITLKHLFHWFSSKKEKVTLKQKMKGVSVLQKDQAHLFSKLGGKTFKLRFCAGTLNLLLQNSINVKALYHQIIKLNSMVKCIQTFTLILTPNECLSLTRIINKASFLFRHPTSTIAIFFRNPNGSETQIQSDDDLLALKYLVRKNQIEFTVKISKTKEQIQQEIIDETVGKYLGEMYQEVIEEQFEREIDEEIQKYLGALYKKLEAQEEKEKLKRIEKEEASRYMSNLSEQIVGRRIHRNIPVRQRMSRKMRISPEKELFKRKEGHIEMMVGRILESMMPVMVKELSYRIVEELKYEKQSIKSYQRELNPQEY